MTDLEREQALEIRKLQAKLNEINNKTVKKNKEGSYFVSMEYCMKECQKYEETITSLKKLNKFLKDENKELEEKCKEAEENLKKVLKLFEGTNYE